jgi:AcrR family transcriptional regulator
MKPASIKMQKRPDEPELRFHKEAWLRAAIEVLAREGQAKLRVDALAHELGLTKGSFYHHFENRDDFVHCLLDYWSRTYTDQIIEEVSAAKGTPEARLLQVMQGIERRGLDRYDIAFRSWAAQEPSVAKSVRKVDLARYRFIRSLFAEMGFEGDDLEDRVRVWLVFESAKRTIYLPKRSGNDEESIIRRHAFLTQALSRASTNASRQKYSGTQK